MLYLFFISFAVSTQTTVSVTVHYGLSVNVWKSSEGPCGLTSVLENGIDGFAKYCLGHFVCFCRNLHRRKSLGKKQKKPKNFNRQTKKAKHNSVSRVSLHLQEKSYGVAEKLWDVFSAQRSPGFPEMIRFTLHCCCSPRRSHVHCNTVHIMFAWL